MEKAQEMEPGTMMKVESRRFGQIELPDDSVLEFTRPILGFPGLDKYALFKEDPEAPLFWLQSLQDPGVSFLLVDPTSVAEYVVESKEIDSAGLDLKGPSEALVLAIVTLKNPWKESTANLRAPVVVNTRTRKAAQVVLHEDRYDTKESIFRDIAQEGR